MVKRTPSVVVGMGDGKDVGVGLGGGVTEGLGVGCGVGRDGASVGGGVGGTEGSGVGVPVATAVQAAARRRSVRFMLFGSNRLRNSSNATRSLCYPLVGPRAAVIHNGSLIL